MARKSKETLLTERLLAISKCPFDIFERIDANEDFFALVKKAESDDLDAINEIINQIRFSKSTPPYANSALLYFSKKAIELGSIDIAKTFISYFTSYHHGYDLIGQAIELLESTLSSEELQSMRPLILECKADFIIHSADTVASAAELLSDMTDIGYNGYALEWLYLLSKASSGENANTVRSLAQDSELTCLIGLPSFGFTPIEKSNAQDAKRAIQVLSANLDRHTAPGWRDFWLICMYELCTTFLNSDFTFIAEDVIASSEKRPYYSLHSLHTFAWAKYLLDNTPPSHPQFERIRHRSNEFYDKCRFERISPIFNNLSDQLNTMKKCVYLSSPDEIKLAKNDNELGAKIEHYKNRYTLVHRLSGHSKRGKMHIWNLVISFRTDNAEKPVRPVFGKLTVSETRNLVSRGGATLDYDRSLSQIICFSEITLNNIPHPFELDLILDISYISAVKCGEGQIKVKDCRFNNGYAIMNCQIMLF